MEESIIGHVPSVDNPANICTNVGPGGQKRNHLICLHLHELCDRIVCLIILLSEEVFWSWRFPCCMGNYI
jgi:hypothetical protein